ncbi:poly-beta-1,6-N-acetyl-D-glucosamine biosynthesis protein PgaD [Halopseudomonas pelagia]|uniref:poly-beta-1,6-N-acetyl-D-glucosamine biosynthesis protein PgaD n=1 Tax=Halopseudomonas pelagia TaxID=553151 RepID=UPI00039EB034|nr:poly-beta-1,6-N-acetyl-D-glucosamine biosynthesis protein PgaD [Halopseudomonas pelagia]|tara:strand:- start:3883 stop:4368 length:486 start_codon:yes stop_codon:yes gene_type:complete
MNLIYTPRHWLPRLIDIILTLIAWVVFVWLLYNGITDLIADQRQGPRIEMGTQLLSGLDSLLLYLVLSLLVACILSIWAAYRKKQAAGFERRKRVPIMSDETLSTSFGVDHRLLKLLQEQQVLTVHNDEHGQLLSVEMRDLNKHYAARKPLVKPELVGELS